MKVIFFDKKYQIASASVLLTFLSENPCEISDRLRLILQEKKVGIDTDSICWWNYCYKW